MRSELPLDFSFGSKTVDDLADAIVAALLTVDGADAALFDDPHAAFMDVHFAVCGGKRGTNEKRETRQPIHVDGTIGNRTETIYFPAASVRKPMQQRFSQKYNRVGMKSLSTSNERVASPPLCPKNRHSTVLLRALHLQMISKKANKSIE